MLPLIHPPGFKHFSEMFCTSKGKTVSFFLAAAPRTKKPGSLFLGEKEHDYHIHFCIREIYSAQIHSLLSFHLNCLCF